MTVIAAISDIHSDYDDLLGVWRMIEAETPPDRIVVNAGDTVGYGDKPEQCVNFFRERPEVHCAGGNYDEHVADFPTRQLHYREKWAKKRPGKYAAIERDSTIISPGSRAWLAGLPHELAFTVNGVRVVVSHYAPGSRKEGLLVVTRRERLEQIAHNTEAKVIVVGHTHMAFIREAGGAMFVNPGSIGRPWGAPAWALIEIVDGKPIRAEIKRWRG